MKIEDAAKEDTEEAKENSEELKPAENADSVAIVDATAEMQKEDERPADLIEPAEETVEPAKASEKPAELTIDSDEQVILTWIFFFHSRCINQWKSHSRKNELQFSKKQHLPAKKSQLDTKLIYAFIYQKFDTFDKIFGVRERWNETWISEMSA